ncbi:MAG: hypothetical protein JWN69_443 [Alphaproteobacteria bacterium]|nr:hypothetical protein [Alphaproteobacteria bacterium]
MTMSRMIALALLAFAATAAGAAPQTAEQAMENYRLTFKPPEARDCARAPGNAVAGTGAPGNEIVVCGKRERPDQRLPLPLDPVPGERNIGEPPSALTAAGTRERCSTVGPNQNCGGGLPLLGAALFLLRSAAALADPDD